MKNYQQIIKVLGKERLICEEPMVNHATFKIGGPAKFYFEAKTWEDLKKAVQAARALKIPYFILGGGSNILVSDRGFAGLVIKNKTDKIKILSYKGSIKHQTSNIKKALVEADSGVFLNRLVRFTIDEGLAGLESFLGIPGTVGGGIYINAHYQDKFLGDYLLGAKILNPQGEIYEVGKDYFRFGYDQSFLKKTGDILISAILELEGGEKKILWQKAMEALEGRKRTQPLDFPSAGCIFQNITKAEAVRLATPNFTQSAGFLIEACGLKGKQIGQAKFSEIHANFIINLGGAKACDVLELINIAKNKVKEKFGLNLKEEIIYVGEF